MKFEITKHTKPEDNGFTLEVKVSDPRGTQLTNYKRLWFQYGEPNLREERDLAEFILRHV